MKRINKRIDWVTIVEHLCIAAVIIFALHCCTQCSIADKENRCCSQVQESQDEETY
jgi:hypothetical protein